MTAYVPSGVLAVWVVVRTAFAVEGCPVDEGLLERPSLHGRGSRQAEQPQEGRREVYVRARGVDRDALPQVWPGGNQRVVDVPRARAAVPGGPTGRDRSAHPVRIRRVRPVRREQNLGGPFVIPARRVERQRARHASIERSRLRRAGEDRPGSRRLLQRCHNRGDGRLVAVANVDRAAARDNARRSVGKRAGERLQDRVEVDGAGVRREAVVGRDPDVVAVEQAGGFEAVLYPFDFPVNVPEDLDRRGCANAVRVRGGVEVAEPHHRHRRVHPRNPDLQERVHRVAIERAGGRALGRRGTERLHVLCERLRQRVPVVQDRAPRDRVVVQERGPGRPRADDEHLPPCRLE